MESMRKPSKRLILLFLRARIVIRAVEPISIAKSSISKFSGAIPPEIAIGSARTIQMLKMLLPTMLPIRRSDSPL